MRRVSEWANKSHPRTKSATSEQIPKAKVKAKNVHRTKNGIRFWYIMWMNEFYCITMTRFENFRWSLYSIRRCTCTSTPYISIDVVYIDNNCCHSNEMTRFEAAVNFTRVKNLISIVVCSIQVWTLNSQLTNRGYKTNNISTKTKMRETRNDEKKHANFDAFDVSIFFVCHQTSNIESFPI